MPCWNLASSPTSFWFPPPDALVEPMDDLYLASAARLLATLRAVAETVRTVLLIGHNPGLHDLALLLADPHASAAKPLHLAREGFPTGTLAEFTMTGPWSLLGAGGGRLTRFLTPRMLDAADRG
jgi:phosphohistidine phosphatase